MGKMERTVFRHRVEVLGLMDREKAGVPRSCRTKGSAALATLPDTGGGQIFRGRLARRGAIAARQASLPE